MKRMWLGMILVPLLVGCEPPTGTLAEQVEVIKACSAACAKMQKWSPREGCICDTSHAPVKPQ